MEFKSPSDILKSVNHFMLLICKGCEDPRIVEFEDNFYIFYTAYDGKTARVAIAKTKDFIEYKKFGVINHYTWDKDAFIFPERIGGKIAYLH